jgi:hypothetical protein
VDLSPAQFAELLTTMNVGGGVPGTMTRFNGQQIEPYEETEHEAQRVKSYFADTMKQEVAEFKKAQEEIESLLENKKNLSKSDRERVNGILDRMIQHLESNTPFYLEQFEESTQKIVTQAKAEVDAFVTNAVVTTGLEALRANSPKLLE